RRRYVLPQQLDARAREMDEDDEQPALRRLLHVRQQQAALLERSGRTGGAPEGNRAVHPAQAAGRRDNVMVDVLVESRESRVVSRESRSGALVARHFSAAWRVFMKRGIMPVLCSLLIMSFVTAQSEKLDYQAIGRIRDEGLNRSQVMDHVSWLSDVYGPRLTGSPAIQQASEWAMKRFNEWGLANVHQERWKFGKGWTLVRFSANMIEPQPQPIIGYPREWSSGTKGPVIADVVRAQINNENDFAKYRGKLAGKIVLTQPERRVRMYEGPNILRMDEKWTKEAEETPVPAAASGRAGGGRGAAAQDFRKKLD